MKIIARKPKINFRTCIDILLAAIAGQRLQIHPPLEYFWHR
jgi:hypothetical protein